MIQNAVRWARLSGWAVAIAVDSSIVSWGTILYWAQNSNALLTGQWILLFAPGLCIALLAMSLTLINFGVDAVGNPRLREGAKQKKEARK